MIKMIVRMSVLALALIALTVPATRMYADTTPSVVTGGDPQPTGEAVPTIIILPSLVVL